MRFVNWKIVAALFIGLLARLALSRVRQVQAQSPEKVPVYIHPETVFDARNGTTVMLPNLHVVGISCISKPVKNAPDAAVCYIASTPADN